jgi:hypothetical protein
MATLKANLSRHENQNLSFFIKLNYLLLFLDSFLIDCAIISPTNLIISPLKNKLKKQ